MRTQWVFAITMVMAVAILIGCGSDNDAPLGDTGDETPATSQDGGSGTRETEPGPKPATPAKPATPLEPADPGPDEPARPEDVSKTEPPSEPAKQRVKADVGVAKQGRSLDDYEGVIVTPAKTLFTVREKAVFQIQIPKALQLYEGLHGSKPKTHEEFMTGIIQANGINLPDLPPGDKYDWDPEKGELMVEKRR